jgi:hypothetical protein
MFLDWSPRLYAVAFANLRRNCIIQIREGVVSLCFDASGAFAVATSFLARWCFRLTLIQNCKPSCVAISSHLNHCQWGAWIQDANFNSCRQMQISIFLTLVFGFCFLLISRMNSLGFVQFP